ncbi:hypothetical protein E4T42_09177 [Aureobasidium subglaciale]|nr:hypothetical protein E4T42_09177 [Aureobasidium subglaciale]
MEHLLHQTVINSAVRILQLQRNDIRDARAAHITTSGSIQSDVGIAFQLQLDELNSVDTTLRSNAWTIHKGKARLPFDTPLVLCETCEENKIWFTVFNARCGHRYCSECLTTLFDLCTRDEEVYPPRCYTQVIPLQLVRQGLSSELIEDFVKKSVEWKTKDRTYCYGTTCSAFIPPRHIRTHTATCHECSRRTCPSCKEAAHTGDCAEDEALQQLLEAADREKWQRCYSCSRVVALSTGCNHITCHCGAEFCYVCGAVGIPRSCECGLGHDYMLEGRRRPADLPSDLNRRLYRPPQSILDQVDPLPQLSRRIREDSARMREELRERLDHQDVLPGLQRSNAVRRAPRYTVPFILEEPPIPEAAPPARDFWAELAAVTPHRRHRPAAHPAPVQAPLAPPLAYANHPRHHRARPSTPPHRRYAVPPLPPLVRCDHNNWRSWVGHSRDCQRCATRMPVLMFTCRECGEQYCEPCKWKVLGQRALGHAGRLAVAAGVHT